MRDAGLLVPQAVEWPLPWGPVVRGMRWAGSSDRALFLHEPGADLDAWGTLPAMAVAHLGLDVVALDLPGHGLSDEPWEADRLPELLGFLAGKPGDGRRRFVVAAGQTSLAALEAAGDLELDGLVAFSPPALPDDRRPGRSPRVPKLLLAGSLAEDDLRAARRLATDCGGWAVVTSAPFAASGTALLATERGAQLAEQVIAFLRDCQRPRPTSGPDMSTAPRASKPAAV